MLKGKKTSPPVNGGNSPLIRGCFFPWVRVPRAPSPSAREVSLLPCYFYPLLGRPLSGKRHAYRGKVRFRFSGKNNCLTWNFEQLCMVHRQELQTIEYLQKWDNLSKNQGEIRIPTKRKKKWCKSTADNQDLNKYWIRRAVINPTSREVGYKKRRSTECLGYHHIGSCYSAFTVCVRAGIFGHTRALLLWFDASFRVGVLASSDNLEGRRWLS